MAKNKEISLTPAVFNAAQVLYEERKPGGLAYDNFICWFSSAGYGLVACRMYVTTLRSSMGEYCTFLVNREGKVVHEV